MSPIPMVLRKKKQPIEAYKQFYENPPSEEWIREQFSRRCVNGIGVHPASSGIAIRDWDEHAAYDQWADQTRLSREHFRRSKPNAGGMCGVNPTWARSSSCPMANTVGLA
jgi:hypothetical protein